MTEFGLLCMTSYLNIIIKKMNGTEWIRLERVNRQSLVKIIPK